MCLVMINVAGDTGDRECWNPFHMDFIVANTEKEVDEIELREWKKIIAGRPSAESDFMEDYIYTIKLSE